MRPSIDEALRNLSATHRDVIVRAYFRRNSTRQIAVELNLSDDVVKARLHAGMRQLTELLRSAPPA